jgi:GNAT superfamily N-acetyltransferase
MSRYLVRKAADCDLALLPSIEAAADGAFDQLGLGPLPPPAEVDVYRKSLIVSVAGDPPIGFARVVEIDKEAHLEQMSVIPRHTSKGVGSDLLRSCIEAARARGYSRLTLITFAKVAWNAIR